MAVVGALTGIIALVWQMGNSCNATRPQRVKVPRALLLRIETPGSPEGPFDCALAHLELIAQRANGRPFDPLGANGIFLFGGELRGVSLGDLYSVATKYVSNGVASHMVVCRKPVQR